MLSLVVTDRSGTVHRQQADTGQPLMETLREAGWVEAVCGGGAACGTCAVRIATPWAERLPAADDGERQLLEGLGGDAAAGGRLSCQIILDETLDGMVLEVLPGDD